MRYFYLAVSLYILHLMSSQIRRVENIPIPEEKMTSVAIRSKISRRICT